MSDHLNATPASFVHPDIPFRGQFETPDLISGIDTANAPPRDDPHWRTSGAATLDEYVLWSKNVCGMACFWMVATHVGRPVPPPITLAHHCLLYGGYRLSDGAVEGLFYNSFVEFARREYEVDADVEVDLDADGIVSAVSSGDIVMASVNSAIARPQSIPPGRGGHLVLVTGYENEGSTLLLHNPSGRLSSREYAPISVADFERFFAGRGVVFRLGGCHRPAAGRSATCE